LLTEAVSKLSDAVALLSHAREERLAAQLEDIIHQVEISLLEGTAPPNLQTNSRMGQHAQEWILNGLEAASRSFIEANKGFQALAREMTEYSKAAFDDAICTWEQLLGVKSLEQAMQIQSDYAKRTYENHMAEMSKLGQMYVGIIADASRPVKKRR
jgi:hypothetical protein